MELKEIKSSILISVIRSIKIISLIGLILGSVSLIVGIAHKWLVG